MPVYDYMCDECGPFTFMRPMAECELPSQCPDCERQAPRVMLTAPFCSTMSAQSRSAHATNERSANEPRVSSKGAHASGCGCCAQPTSRFAKSAKGAAKSFPGSRPWMISH